MKMLPRSSNESLAVRHEQDRHSRRQGAAPMYLAADQAQRGFPDGRKSRACIWLPNVGFAIWGVQGR